MNHTIYMRRALELAAKGAGMVAPNPMVGAVLVADGRIIGEGFHEKYGGPHAEVNAINNVGEDDIAHIKKGTLYVTLEPCSHFGKTPPCSDLIIEKEIPEVIIATTDPNPLVAGKGIEKLKKAGCKVELGVLQEEAREQNRRFFTFHIKKRPYIILKWAQNKDGFIGIEGEKVQISNDLSKVINHKWRSEEAAIMIGTKTAAVDNPQLNVRHWHITRKDFPVRVVLDRELKLPLSLHLFDETQRTIVFHQQNIPSERKDNVGIDFSQNIISQILQHLHRLDIQSVIVEGGAQLINSFIEQNLWDEARVFIGNGYIKKGIKAPGIEAVPVSEEEIGDNLLRFYRNL